MLAVKSAVDTHSSVLQKHKQTMRSSEPNKAPTSPLTLALLRSRWLTAYSTPGHNRGESFALGVEFGG